MANKEHLEILRRGVKEWNAWREEHPEIEPDLVGASLAGANLHRANLDRAKLVVTNLDDGGAKLRDARLLGTHLVRANLGGARLGGAYLAAARLYHAHFGGARLRWTAIVDIDLSHSEGLETVDHRGAPPPTSRRVPWSAQPQGWRRTPLDRGRSKRSTAAPALRNI